jgi:hypothetical protein
MTSGKAGGLKNRKPFKADQKNGRHLKVAPSDARPSPPGHNPSVPEMSNSMSPPAKPGFFLNENNQEWRIEKGKLAQRPSLRE